MGNESSQICLRGSKKLHSPFIDQVWSRYKMPKKAENPFKMGYDPELDTSPELDPNAASYYLTIICILRWMVKLGRIDVITEVLLLSYHVALPREGHLKAAVHVMAQIYLQIVVCSID